MPNGKCLLLLGLLAAGRTFAWGDLGHQVTALIAYRHLTPAARAGLDALLASDTDALTPADFASRASWADRSRSTHRETAAWHYVNIEIDQPDINRACYNFPALSTGQAASLGPAEDCIVDKIEEFAAELKAPATTPAERLLALKFLIHFVGDLHQPLHASDHHDRGGNCIALSPSPDGGVSNLHAFWDITVVDALGSSPPQIAAALDATITQDEITRWNQGTVRSWTLEVSQLSLKDAYSLPAKPTCSAPGSIALTVAYQEQAKIDAAEQIKKAGIRMAGLLNQALGQTLLDFHADAAPIRPAGNAPVQTDAHRMTDEVLLGHEAY
jgi:hypothetical protein